MDLLDSETKQETDQCHKERRDSLNQTSVQCYERSKTSPEQNHSRSLAVPSQGDGGSQPKTETLCPARLRREREGEESEKEETESSDDNTTQYSIHPPHDCPYLLLLQGCSLTQVSHSHTLQSRGEVGRVILGSLFTGSISPIAVGNVTHSLSCSVAWMVLEIMVISPDVQY